MSISEEGGLRDWEIHYLDVLLMAGKHHVKHHMIWDLQKDVELILSWIAVAVIVNNSAIAPLQESQKALQL